MSKAYNTSNRKNQPGFREIPPQRSQRTRSKHGPHDRNRQHPSSGRQNPRIIGAEIPIGQHSENGQKHCTLRIQGHM